MTGSISMIMHENGIELTSKLRDVSVVDKMCILDSLCRGIEIDNAMLKMYCALKDSGIMNEVVESVGLDLSELMSKE